LQLNDLIVQYRRLILPNQAVLAIAFSEEREGLFNYLSRRWGSWIRKNPAPFIFRRSHRYTEPEIAIVEADRRQGIVSWGLLGFEKSSRESISMEVLEQYLTLTLPTWASEISSAGQIRGSIESTSMRMPGYLRISIEIPVQHLSSYYSKLFSTLDSMSRGDIDQSQFEDAKQIVFAEFRASLEQTEGQMSKVLETDLYELGINFIPTFGLRLSRVSESKFQEMIKSLVPDKSHIMIAAGPRQEIEEQIAKNR
jgi:predicted Zn-dependent peptidase